MISPQEGPQIGCSSVSRAICYHRRVVQPILERWTSRPERDATRLVFPDGCRDVILVRSPGTPWKWILTDLDDGARAISVKAHSEYQGWRLRPGTSIDPTALRRALELQSLEDLQDSQIEECCRCIPNVEEILEVLSESTHVVGAAQLAGTSLRTLQRATSDLTGRKPMYWIRLARARRAARAISENTPLREAAAIFGFSDQAHMTREFQRWFSVTPGEVGRHEAKTEGIYESGFGIASPTFYR